MTAARVNAVDLDDLDEQIRRACRLMRTHAGAIELVDVTSEGIVTVRFLGMCQGCGFRPMSLYGFVIPMLEQVEGVTEVRAEGVRVSRQAAERGAATLRAGGSSIVELLDRPITRPG